MTLGTPAAMGVFVAALTWDTVRSVRVAWEYEYRYQWQEWFAYFGEKHRRSLHSLGLKPERGGTQMFAPAEDVQ